jgi:ferrochelatase
MATDGAGNGGTGIVLMNLGGPETLEDVRPFLLELFADREIIQLPFQGFLGPFIAKRRTKGVQELYEGIGGGSPILHWTSVQGQGMVERLDELSPGTAPHRFYVAFRYIQPTSEDALRAMKADGIERAVAFTQYQQFSCATTGSSLNELWRAASRLGMTRDDVLLRFSAHSLPLSIIDRGDPYPQEVGASVHEVMKAGGFPNRFLLAYQSEVGPVRWQGPSTEQVIKDLGAQGRKNVLVVGIAFTSDHIETLSEIDIEYGELAHQVGIERFERAPAFNGDPDFQAAMADIVLAHLRSGEACSKQYGLRCPGCTNPQCRNILNPVAPFDRTPLGG